MANFPVGINAMRQSYYDPATVCADIFAFQCNFLRCSQIQTTLAEDYVAGQGYMILAEPEKFWGEGMPFGSVVTIIDGKAQVKPASGPVFSFNCKIVVGTNKLFITSIFSGTDADCPAGCYVDNKRSSWNNSQGTKIADPLIIDGVDTGWPKGLSAGQYLSFFTHSGVWKPSGTYTVTAKGTGTIIIQCPGTSNKTISFVDGVPTGSNTFTYNASTGAVWIINVTASSASNSFYDPRIITPGTLADGVTTYVQDYEDHADEPGYRSWYEPYKAMFTHFGFDMLRDINTQPINLGSPRTLSLISETEDGQHMAGLSNDTGPSVEDFLRLPLSMGMDAWYCIPHRWSDEAITRFGHRANAMLPSGRKVAVEYINEIWNWGYQHKPWCCMRWGLEVAQCSITRSGGTATVTKPGHGFSDDDTVIITGALQEEYNGTFTVANATTNTFTYSVSGSPASPASTEEDGRVMAYRDNSVAKTVTSLTANLSSDGLTFTAVYGSDPSYVVGDFASFSGLDSVRANGVLRCIAKTNSTTYQWAICPGSIRPLPDLVDATTSLGAAEGQTIKSRLICGNVATTESNANGIPWSDEAASKWSGRRHAQIHAILAPILGSKLVRVIGGWSNVPSWNDRTLEQYRLDNGGTFPAGTNLAIAPYFYASNTGANKADETTLISLLAGGMSREDALELLISSVGDFITADTRVQTIKTGLPAGVGLVMYEFGQHLAPLDTNKWNEDLVAVYIAFNRDPRLEGLYDQYLAKLAEDGIEWGLHYSFISAFDRYGSWGLYEYMGQSDNGKATALKNFMSGEDPPDPPAGTRYAIYLTGGKVIRLKERVVA